MLEFAYYLLRFARGLLEFAKGALLRRNPLVLPDGPVTRTMAKIASAICHMANIATSQTKHGKRWQGHKKIARP